MAAGHRGHDDRGRHRAVEVRQVHLLLGGRARSATILRFAERAVEQGLDFRWGAEIRLEKYWSDERCELLRRSGCVAISVGFESGNQRILDLIDKGTKPEQVRRTMTAMTKANIGVQMMGFTGFPTETREEALDSITFLRENPDLWTLGGLGDFMLTPGAIVAKEPDRFGITNVRPVEGSDIVRMLQYDEPVTEAAQAEIAQAKADLNPGHFHRPWLGSTDTPHTFFYHDRYGTAVRGVLAHDRVRHDTDDQTQFLANGTFVDRDDEQVWEAYRRIRSDEQDGSPGELPADRHLFRRADGLVFALNRSSRLFLDLHRPAHPRRRATSALDRRTDGRRPGLADLHRAAAHPPTPTPERGGAVTRPPPGRADRHRTTQT